MTRDSRHTDTSTALPATRRRVVLGAAAASAGAAGGSLALGASAASAAPPQVVPHQSNTLYLDFGVNAFPNKRESNYRYFHQWINALDGMNASYFRGLYERDQDRTLRVVRKCRRRGMRWLMQIVPDISISNREIRRSVRHIARNAADVCLAIEGPNEPDWVRGQGPASGWEDDTVRVQRVLWEAVRSHPELSDVLVLGPTLRQISTTGADYRRLADLGITDHLDMTPIHSYPNGNYPDFKLAPRIREVVRAWPGKAVWLTETGYHNAMANTAGQKPVPEWVSGRYAPIMVLEGADHHVRTTWFEALDQPDAGARDIREAHFGLFALEDNDPAPPWRSKRAAAELRDLLGQLKDPGPFFDPTPVGFAVSSPTGDVRATLTQKRDGSTYAHLRRATSCWDPIAQEPIRVARVTATLQTDSGERTVRVGSQVRTVRL